MGRGQNRQSGGRVYLYTEGRSVLKIARGGGGRNEY